ncbi:hypothetical protein DL96DRAFT_1712543 [Flagelloscypha sp. PMI_526]|nr:hypothetical protein DL96DRAFT_1712543 [Flagelloscypha sp. PMI_526]
MKLPILFAAPLALWRWPWTKVGTFTFEWAPDPDSSGRNGIMAEVIGGDSFCMRFEGNVTLIQTSSNVACCLRESGECDPPEKPVIDISLCVSGDVDFNAASSELTAPWASSSNTIRCEII